MQRSVYMSAEVSRLHAEWDAISVQESTQRAGFKWEPYRGTDLIPAWVADMDIPASRPIADAIVEFYARGDLGYFDETIFDRAKEVCAERFGSKYGWTFPVENVELVSDTVQSLHLMVQHYSHPGDHVAIITPVYHHFYNAVIENGRIPVNIPLRSDGAGYSLDPDAIRKALADERVKLLLLCHPHNPTGKVFTPAELQMIGDAAAAAGVTVISDEIHADITFGEQSFVPFALAARETGAVTVTLTSAGKAFNIAGTHLGFIIYSHPEIRRQGPRFPSRALGKPGIAGCLATITAWTSQETWLDAAVTYLKRNRDTLDQALQGAAIDFIPPQATYLAWLDLREFSDDARGFLIENARIVTNSGSDFSWPRGTGGSFARLNFAVPRALMSEITERLVAALTSDRARRGE